MQELVAAIPDVDTLLALEPEELGEKVLFIIRGRTEPKFNLGSLKNDFVISQQNQPTYPQNKLDDVVLALSEAFAWLEAQGLIVHAAAGGEHGWRVLSRRARKFEDEAEFAKYAAARHLQKESLHPRISGSVWNAFMRGEYDVAVLQAMKAVEVAVREAAGLAASDIGPRLMRKAFDVDEGPLTDMETEKSERQARGDLFAGAMGSYKNPHSHRDVNLNDPIEAAEIVLLANHLLRIVDARRSFRQAGGSPASHPV